MGELHHTEPTLHTAIEDAALEYRSLFGKDIDVEQVNITFIRLVVEKLVVGLGDLTPDQHEFARGMNTGISLTMSFLYDRLGQTILKTPNGIISDEEVQRVHKNANFGPRPPRSIIDEGVVEHAFGYSGGSVRTAILLEHGLIHKPRAMGYKAALTEKGREYLRTIISVSKVKELLKR